MNAPVTLGDLMRDDKLLWVYCCTCGHERDVTPATRSALNVFMPVFLGKGNSSRHTMV